MATSPKRNCPMKQLSLLLGITTALGLSSCILPAPAAAKNSHQEYRFELTTDQINNNKYSWEFPALFLLIFKVRRSIKPWAILACIACTVLLFKLYTKN